MLRNRTQTLSQTDNPSQNEHRQPFHQVSVTRQPGWFHPFLLPKEYVPAARNQNSNIVFICHVDFNTVVTCVEIIETIVTTNPGAVCVNVELLALHCTSRVV